MKTPICDFVRDYAASGAIRMHMPGHKGDAEAPSSDPYSTAFSNIARYDITEIADSDELFHPTSIIAESERNASELFGCPTYYSTEGSSLCIRAMMHLCVTNRAAQSGVSPAKAPAAPWILAARNVHSSFVSACALLDIDAEWIASKNITFVSADVDADDVSEALAAGISKHGSLPCCVYITSPDYAGHILPIASIAEVCHANHVPLVVDNAHGAYLKFLTPSQHPMDLGADMCCDSAHKTLPVLTGGAYLHVREDFITTSSSARKALLSAAVKNALSIFASTSPSWLILQSLDRTNLWLSQGGKKSFKRTEERVHAIRDSLTENGLTCYGEDTMKITILTRGFGYTGDEFAQILREKKIEVEFSDPDMIVLMITPKNTDRELDKLKAILTSIPQKNALPGAPDVMAAEEAGADAKTMTETPVVFPEKKMSIRDASMCTWEIVPVKDALGKIAAMGSFFCPPAIPIVMPGELIGEREIRQFEYYGYNECKVIQKL